MVSDIADPAGPLRSKNKVRGSGAVFFFSYFCLALNDRAMRAQNALSGIKSDQRLNPLNRRSADESSSLSLRPVNQ